MKKVSIIIPVYNVKKYLSECLNSVINQTYQNVEILVIDDGSTDGSDIVCDEYKKYDKIKIFHQKNHGVSCARNFGIENASGDYIMFVDSDDYVSVDFVEKMVKQLEISKADCVCCRYYSKYIDKNILSLKFENKNLTSKNAIIKLFDDESIKGFCYNKIFLRQIIVDNKIRFNPQISMCEDLLFVFNYFMSSKKVEFLNDGLYYYRMRKNSALNRYTEKNLSVFAVYNEILNIFPEVQHNIEKYYRYNYFKYRKLLKKNLELYNVKKINSFTYLLLGKDNVKIRIKNILRSYMPLFIVNIFKSNKNFYE